MFKTRLMSGIVLVLIALLTIGSGGIVLFVTLLGVSLIGMQELYRAMGVRENTFHMLEIAGYAGAILYYVMILLDFQSFAMPALLLALVLCIQDFGQNR